MILRKKDDVVHYFVDSMNIKTQKASAPILESEMRTRLLAEELKVEVIFLGAGHHGVCWRVENQVLKAYKSKTSFQKEKRIIGYLTSIPFSPQIPAFMGAGFSVVLQAPFLLYNFSAGVRASQQKAKEINPFSIAHLVGALHTLRVDVSRLKLCGAYEVEYLRRHTCFTEMDVLGDIIARHDEALRLAEAMARKKVLLHNDLRPGNVIIGEERWVLIDFSGCAHDLPEYEFRHYRKWPMGWLQDVVNEYELTTGVNLSRKLIELLSIIREFFLAAVTNNISLWGRAINFARLYISEQPTYTEII